MRKINTSLLFILTLFAFSLVVFFGCDNSWMEEIFKNYEDPNTVHAAITVIAPVTASYPNTAISMEGKGDFYASEVSWFPDHSPFRINTQYTATVTLFAVGEEYIFPERFNVTINGNKADVSNKTEDMLTASYTFAPTGFLPITSADITVTAPVKNMTPDYTAYGTGNFTVGQVSWSPALSDGKFMGSTQYTAEVRLTRNDNNYTFTGMSNATINGNPAEISDNNGSGVTLSYQFPSTAARTLVDAIITDPPNKLDYYHGEKLDLSGLMLRLTYDDGLIENVGHNDSRITTTPTNNSVLDMYQDGTTIAVYVNGAIIGYTNPLTVTLAPENVPNTFIITVAQIEDASVAEVSSDVILSRSGSVYPSTATFTLQNSGLYDNIEWYYNGGTPIKTGPSFTFSVSPGTNYNVNLDKIAKHYLTLWAYRGDKPYSVRIEFEVVE